ncbi:MAG: hypothetical protein GSR72_04765 [Desulfurococcales archaeon]|nr:hypothetical protein [Desulfurococcales archaeon]
MSSKKAIGVYIDPKVKKQIAVIAAQLDVPRSRLYEVGARIVLALLEEGRVPRDLQTLLRIRDPALLPGLLGLLEAKRRIPIIEGP